MIIEIKAPNKYEEYNKTNDEWDDDFVYYKKIFLAGSIEMGVAEKWQDKIVNLMPEITKKDDNIVILNPRRDDWDSSWTQSINNKQFNEQVTWELQALEDSDIIFMYFDPNTKSPISLLEFGLFCKTHNMVVICPEGFWRKGNVEITCKKYNIQFFHTLDECITFFKENNE